MLTPATLCNHPQPIHTRGSQQPQKVFYARPRDPFWEDGELIPFLQYAFAHFQPLHYDYKPHVEYAFPKAADLVSGRMPAASFPEPLADSTIEDIYLAVKHRWANADEEAAKVIDDPDLLTLHLLIFYQCTGPYQLHGRSDTGSAAYVQRMRTRQFPEPVIPSSERRPDVYMNSLYARATFMPRRANRPYGWQPGTMLNSYDDVQEDLLHWNLEVPAQSRSDERREADRRRMPPPPRPQARQRSVPNSGHSVKGGNMVPSSARRKSDRSGQRTSFSKGVPRLTGVTKTRTTAAGKKAHSRFQPSGSSHTALKTKSPTMTDQVCDLSLMGPQPLTPPLSPPNQAASAKRTTFDRSLGVIAYGIRNPRVIRRPTRPKSLK